MFSLLGSFWTQMYAKPSDIRKLVAIMQKSSSFGEFTATVSGLAGDILGGQMVEGKVWKFKGSDVFITGELTYDDPEIDAVYTGTEVPDALYSNFKRRFYGLPLDSITPIRIVGRTRTLVKGQDFFVTSKFLLFAADPVTEFPDGKIVIELGLDGKRRDLWFPLLRYDAGTSRQYLINYFRSTQTPQAFKLAVAAVAGYAILPAESKLVEILEKGHLTTYVFSDIVVDVDYPHTQLVAGKVYPKHFVIGDGVQVHHGNPDTRAWWRAVDWRGGIVLDPLTLFKNLPLKDEMTTLYSAGSEESSANGSKLHARVKLGAYDQDEEERYWVSVAGLENRLGIYLNTMARLPEDAEGYENFEELVERYEAANELNETLGLPLEHPEVENLVNSKLTNALDFYFQTFLGYTGMVVVLDCNYIRNQTEVFRFVHSELPIGVVPVILAYAPTLPEEVINLTTNLKVEESVTIRQDTPIGLSETIGLPSLVRESVTIRAELPSDEI